MSNVIKGTDVILEFEDASGDFMTFACARGITVNMTSDITGKSTVGSGDWKEKEIVALDWNFQIDGVVYIGNDGQTDAISFYQIWLGKTPINIRYILNDQSANLVLQMSGAALITSVSTNGAVNQVAGITINGEGTGALQITGPFEINNALLADDKHFLQADDDTLIITY
jgi:predicted secreted protein